MDTEVGEILRPLIQDRLKNISDLNDRKKLRAVLLDVYEKLLDYNENMYTSLEKKIYSYLYGLIPRKYKKLNEK